MTISLYILVKYQKKKKIKCVSEQKILTIEDLHQMFYVKKCVFIFVITLCNWWKTWIEKYFWLHLQYLYFYWIKYKEWGNTHLDLLYQKLLRYQHHWENYQTSLLEGLTPSGLRIKKRPAINSISDTFEKQWNFVLYDAEKKLVQLLLKESEHIISKIKIQIEIKN